MKRTSLILALLFFFLPLGSSAQLGVGGDALTIIITPERPGAHAQVDAFLESYSIDLSRSYVRWNLNGKTIAEGDGVVNASFKTGAFGEAVRLSVSALTVDGNILSKTLVLRPAEVSLVWQTNSYVPPFYKGKALFPLQGDGTVIAVPSFPDGEGGFLNPKELIYTWSEGGNVVADGSGFGKDAFPVIGRIPIRPLAIAVDAATRDGSLNGRAEISIEQVQPALRLYEDHPLYGIRFERALFGLLPLFGKEIKVAAVPYFFEVSRRGTPALSYNWSLNGEALTRERKEAVTLRRVSDELGISRLLLRVQREGKLFQGSEAGVNIEMKEEVFGNSTEN